MLACYVTANLWKKSFISGDVLEKNVLCITFGQPLVGIPYVEEAIKAFPQLEATIHSVYDKEDFFPRVFHYFAAGCHYYHSSSQAVKNLSQATAESLLTTDLMVKVYMCCGSIVFFTICTFVMCVELWPCFFMQVSPGFGSNPKGIDIGIVAKFQDLHLIIQQSYSRAITSSETRTLTEFKKLLSEIIPLAQNYQSKTFGNCYIIQSVEGLGIQWVSTPSKMITNQENLGISIHEKVDVTSFKKASNLYSYHVHTFIQFLFPCMSCSIAWVNTVTVHLEAFWIEIQKNSLFLVLLKL